MFSYLVFTYRRTIRRWRRKLQVARRDTKRYVDRHIWGKWHQIRLVRRLFILWFGLIAISLVGLVHQSGSLAKLNQILRPLPGGTYAEASVGSVKILNPVLPESGTSSDINRLLFSGLTQYDQHRHLVGDLATRWDISTDGRSYTFHLRTDVKWHDGVPFTSADVLFTLAAIQNPDSRSPLAASWQGVTATAPDDHTVVYNLPTAFTPFLDSTTVGIVPRHLLESVDPSQLRETSFNQNPVGTGPFKLIAFEPKAGEVTLAANPNYYGGRPKLDNFDFKLYPDSAAALQAYVKHQVNAVSNVPTAAYGPASKMQDLTLRQYQLPAETVLFMRMSDPVLSDVSVRQALAASFDRPALAQSSGDKLAVALTQPILPGQIGYTTKYQSSSYDPKRSAALLSNDGWQRSGGGVWTKNGNPLSLSVVTLSGSEYQSLAEAMRTQLKNVGIDLRITTASAEELQQSFIRPRNYQMLLYGISIGADPDVYAYWHSSQIADPGLNLSKYQSSDADKALESGRVKQDPLIREGKYQSFLKAWNADVPAVVIESIPYLYGVSENAMGLQSGDIVDSSDRFYQVEKWTIRTRYSSIGHL